jgi:hypothetical protein
MHYKRRSRSKDSNYDIDWDSTSRERKLPVEDGPSNGKIRSKRTKPKKDKCPVNGTHEWYKEWVEWEHYYYTGLPGWRDCDTCSWDRWRYFYCAKHRERHDYTIREHRATCIHCWVTKVLKRDSGRFERYSWRRNRRLKLKKRTVKF